MIFQFFKIAASRHLGFNQNWSSNCEEIAIFPFFKMAAGGSILDY